VFQPLHQGPDLLSSRDVKSLPRRHRQILRYFAGHFRDHGLRRSGQRTAAMPGRGRNDDVGVEDYCHLSSGGRSVSRAARSSSCHTAASAGGREVRPTAAASSRPVQGRPFSGISRATGSPFSTRVKLACSLRTRSTQSAKRRAAVPAAAASILKWFGNVTRSVPWCLHPLRPDSRASGKSSQHAPMLGDSTAKLQRTNTTTSKNSRKPGQGRCNTAVMNRVHDLRLCAFVLNSGFLLPQHRHNPKRRGAAFPPHALRGFFGLRRLEARRHCPTVHGAFARPDFNPVTPPGRANNSRTSASVSGRLNTATSSSQPT